MPLVRGRNAPQNVFLETLANKFDGSSKFTLSAISMFVFIKTYVKITFQGSLITYSLSLEKERIS